MNNPFQNSQNEPPPQTVNAWERPPQSYGFQPWIPPVWSSHPFGYTEPPPVEPYSWSGHKPPEHEFNTSSHFGCPPPGHYSDGRFANNQHDRQSILPPQGSAGDESALQRQQDIGWVRRFTQGRRKQSGAPLTRLKTTDRPILTLKNTVFEATELLSKLKDICHNLKVNLHSDSGWQDSYLAALHLKKELQNKHHYSMQLKAKVSRQKSRRVRPPSEEEMKLRADREAAIDARRMKQMLQVEERIKEKEMKQAADSVLCEVRKKQADVKRMQDILRSLEKLRKLRKEAASRKGIVSPLECDEAFSNGLEQLHCVMKRRTAIYGTEEKALMVMLEGEREEERRREWERRVRKETGKQLERKRKVDSMLFGDEGPADCVLQLFTQYYTQGQHSLHVLIDIRNKWDMYAVTGDHPDGSSVPQSWILPEAPSDSVWASALQTADSI